MNDNRCHRVQVRKRPDRRLLQLFYVDHVTRQDVTKSAGTDDPAEAERQAALWQAELEQHGKIGRRVSWAALCVRFYDEYSPARSRKTGKAYKSALKALSNAIGADTWLDEIDASMISRAQAKWRALKLSDASIATYLRHLLVVFRWAKSIKLVRDIPGISIPRSPRRRLQRGRALTDSDFRKFVKAIPSVVGNEKAPQYERLCRGLWLSGLRLQEALSLSWDSPPIQVDLDGGRYPRLIIHWEGQKARRDEIVPITPDFAGFLSKTPKSKRVGRVFPMPLNYAHKVSGKLSQIGRESGVVVNDKGKYASAHDLRSSFATRWKRKVHPMTLKLLMRHGDISTTLKYYIDDDADDAAGELWSGKNCTANCTEKGRPKRHSLNGHHRKTRRKTRLR